MSSVKDILSRKGGNAISVEPETTVFNALHLMAEKNIGSVIVLTANKEFVGIVTERDYSRKVILKGKNSTSTQVSEIMTTDLPRVKPEDSIDHCMELMTVNNVRYLPVFIEDKLGGIISISDVIRETILVQQQTINHLDNYIHSR
jgi:Predicted signal-transduction protein containing cAMP-binding and CBS domains